MEKREIKRREQTVNALLTRQADRNWDGDEPIADAVLRMLVDKYKPLRSGTITTADEKLSKAAPSVRVVDNPSDSSFLSPELTSEGAPTTSERALAYPEVDRSKPLKDQPLLPAVDGHRPWHTNFKAPSHATASVRLGNIEPVKSSPSPVLDEKARKQEKENRKRFQTAFKLEGAKESILDHRLGVQQQKRPQANPITMKGWRTLVEERIEACHTHVSRLLAVSHSVSIRIFFMKNARVQGRFNNIKGQGKPIVTTNDENNPFIGREEFLMNRIVQRNGAAPPWVELQAGKIGFILAFNY